MKYCSTTLAVSIKSFAAKTTIVAAAVLIAASGPMVLGSSVVARNFDAEINAQRKQRDELQAKASHVSAMADTYEEQLSRTRAEQRAIEGQITETQKRLDKIVAKIKQTEEKIEYNAFVSGEIINDMAIADDEPLFMQLATSDNIADVIDTFENQMSVQKELKRSTDETKRLQKDLEKQEDEEKLIALDQENQRAELASKQAEQKALVDETRGEEAAYRELAEEKNAEIKRLQEEQRAAIAAAYSGSGGGMIAAGNLPAYSSWAGANCYVDNAGYSHRGARGNGQDPVGYGCNQCVSYTAWKMGQEIGYIPSYWGNANMWPASARAAGFKVTSQQPPAGQKALGVMSAGRWGHIVYIESSNPSAGTVDISQYNEWIDGKGFGYYSTRTGVEAWRYDTYIYL